MPPGFQLQLVVELNRDTRNLFADQGMIWDKTSSCKYINTTSASRSKKKKIRAKTWSSHYVHIGSERV